MKGERIILGVNWNFHSPIPQGKHVAVRELQFFGKDKSVPCNAGEVAIGMLRINFFEIVIHTLFSVDT